MYCFLNVLMAMAFGMTSAVFSFVTTGCDGEEKARVE